MGRAAKRPRIGPGFTVARQLTCPAVIQAHLERFRCHKSPVPMINSAPVVLYCCKWKSISRLPCHACAGEPLPCRSQRDGRRTELPRRDAPECATLALQISFLLGRQAMLGQDPRSIGAPRRAAVASIAPLCQASNLPPCPLPGSGLQTVLVRHELPPCATLDLFRNLPVDVRHAHRDWG